MLRRFAGHRRAEAAEESDHVEELGHVEGFFEDHGGLEILVTRASL